MNALEVVEDRKNSIRSVILNGEAIDREKGWVKERTSMFKESETPIDLNILLVSLLLTFAVFFSQHFSKSLASFKEIRNRSMSGTLIIYNNIMEI